MQELNHHSKHPWGLPSLIAAFCVALQSSGFSQALRFDRSMIDSGDWWLLLSCNFVHLGTNHLLLNLTGLALVYFLLWPNFHLLSWLFVLLLSSIGVGMGLYLWNPELQWYVGLSGVLHGLIIAGAVADCRRYPVSGSILLIMVLAKLIWEQYFGALPGSAEVAGGHVVVDSHLYGAICGFICAVLLLLGNWIKKSGD